MEIVYKLLIINYLNIMLTLKSVNHVNPLL